MTEPDFQTTLTPLALLITLGWLAGRFLDVDLKTIATIVVYAITPVFAFVSTSQLSFHGSYVLLPLIMATLATTIGLTAFKLGPLLLKQKEMRYLLPMATGTGNNGYFGLPLAMTIFAPDQVGVYFLITMGVTLFEATLGYYFVARGNLSVQEAFRRAVRMPVIYAIAAGLACAALHVAMPAGILKLGEAAKGCYVCLGMMIIGMALGKNSRLSWQADFIAFCILGKHMLWTLAVSTFIYLDTTFFHLYDIQIHQMMLIIAITPVAANMAAYAAQNNFKPQLAATVVFLSTLMSFALLPFTLAGILAMAR